MQNLNELSSQEKAVIGRKKMNDREAERAAIRERIRELERQRDQISAEVMDSSFEDRCRAHIEDLKKEYVDMLCGQVRNGLTPKFNLASPSALAYFFGDMVINDLPGLAEKVTGKKKGNGSSADQLQIIANELIALHCEHASLGGTYRK